MFSFGLLLSRISSALTLLPHPWVVSFCSPLGWQPSGAFTHWILDKIEGKTHCFFISASISLSRAALHYLAGSITIHYIKKQPKIHFSFTRWAAFSSLRNRSLCIYINPRYFSQEPQDDLGNTVAMATTEIQQ